MRLLIGIGLAFGMAPLTLAQPVNNPEDEEILLYESPPVVDGCYDDGRWAATVSSVRIDDTGLSGACLSTSDQEHGSGECFYVWTGEIDRDMRVRLLDVLKPGSSVQVWTSTCGAAGRIRNVISVRPLLPSAVLAQDQKAVVFSTPFVAVIDADNGNYGVADFRTNWSVWPEGLIEFISEAGRDVCVVSSVTETSRHAGNTTNWKYECEDQRVVDVTYWNFQRSIRVNVLSGRYSDPSEPDATLFKRVEVYTTYPPGDPTEAYLSDEPM